MKKLVALFPGQGAQFVGMGKSLYENFAVAKQTFEEASDAISVNLKKLCFDGPESDLTLTENTQPALVTVSVAAFRVAVQEKGFTPSIVAGHSLGEYSALVAAGSLNFSDAVKFVRTRGQAMQSAVPAGQGQMAAVMGMSDELVLKLCEQATKNAIEKRSKGASPDLTVEAIVEPANFNAPGQIVIAGSTDGVQEALALMASDAAFKARAIPLSVSAPFHCKLMKPAREKMADVFSKLSEAQKPKVLNCAYVPNRTARMTEERGVVLELLIDQIDHPVLWKQTIETLVSAGYTESIEFGPGKVLAGLSKRIGGMQTRSVGDTEAIQALEDFR